MAVLNTHHLAFGRLSSHGLHLRGAGLWEAGTIWASSNEAFGTMLLMEPKMVNQLLLDLEGLSTFFTLVPVEGMGKDEDNTIERYFLKKILKIFWRGLVWVD